MHWMKLVLAAVNACTAGGCATLAGRVVFRSGNTTVTANGDGTGAVTVDVETPTAGGSVTIADLGKDGQGK